MSRRSALSGHHRLYGTRFQGLPSTPYQGLEPRGVNGLQEFSTTSTQRLPGQEGSLAISVWGMGVRVESRRKGQSIDGRGETQLLGNVIAGRDVGCASRIGPFYPNERS